MNQRLMLCLLLCGVMLYYAVPRLSLTTGGPEALFSGMWLLFALFAVAGNLTGLLFSPRKRNPGKYVLNRSDKERIKYYQ